MEIGKYRVSLSDSMKATLRMPVFLRPIPGLPSDSNYHEFFVRLPGFASDILVGFRGDNEDQQGSWDDLTPFYVLEPEKLVCECGTSIAHLVHMMNTKWAERHVQECPKCHVKALHVAPGKGMHCLACENTGVVPMPVLGFQASHTE